MANLGKEKMVVVSDDDVAAMGTNEGRSGPNMVRVGTEAKFQEMCSSSTLRLGSPLRSPLPSRGTGQFRWFAGGNSGIDGLSTIAGSAIGPQIAVPVVGPAPVVEENPEINIDGPTVVAVGNTQSFANLCDRARLTAGPGDLPVVGPEGPAPVVEENPEINIDGPAVVAVGNAQSFADLCDRARLTAGPGDPAPVVEERGGHAHPGRNLGPFLFLLIVSLMLGMARSQVLEGDLLVKTAFREFAEIPIEFPQNPFNVRDNVTTGAKYRNLTVDAGIRAMSVAGHEQSEVDANGVYIKGLLGHLKSGLATPLRKDGEGNTNICELFDRDTKQGSDSRRNWGIFYPNVTQKYTINFSGSARIGGSGRGLLKMVVGGLVLAISAVLLLQ